VPSRAEVPRAEGAADPAPEYRIAHSDCRRAVGEGRDPGRSPARPGDVLAAIGRGRSPGGRAPVFTADVRGADRRAHRPECFDAVQDARADPAPAVRVRQSPCADGKPRLMRGTSPDHERYRLLSGWCDGSLDDAGLERLDELLRTDPGFRDLYLKYMDQHAILAASVLPIGDVRLMVQCPGPAGDEPAGNGQAVWARSGAGSRDRRVGRPARAHRAWRRWLAVAAAVVLLLAGVSARHWATSRHGAAIVA